MKGGQEMDEIHIIKEAQNGDRKALSELLTDNYSILKGYTLKITGDPDLAQDITQEAMLKAVLNIKKFRPEAKFSTYLITIATNTYRDYLRKNKRLEPIDDDIVSSAMSVEEISLNNIQYSAVLNILSKMPYEKKAVFVLKHYYGYKYEEIAAILGCPIGTVRSGLHYCIKYIKDELERRKLL